MTDNATDNYFADHAQIRRIAARAKVLAALPLDERLAEQARMAEKVRKHNCQFCKRFPEKCK